MPKCQVLYPSLPIYDIEKCNHGNHHVDRDCESAS